MVQLLPEKNTRNNFFRKQNEKEKIGKSLLIECLSNLASQTFFWTVLNLYFNLIKGELCLETNKDPIISKGIILLIKNSIIMN